MAKNNGLGGPSMGLLRPSVPPESPAVDDAAPPADAAPEVEGESRGEAASESTSRTGRARRRPAPTGKGKSRNLHLPEDIYVRLSLVALQKQATLSAVAVEYLDKSLPRFEVKRQG
jgi:hypothetical protein